jgi:uncharacterized protein
MLDFLQSFFAIPLIAVAALVLVAFVAGFIDSIAGGGGLLAVPATLIAGIPQVEALATCKMQATFGSFSATRTFAKAGKIEFATAWPWVIWTFAGSIAGALVVQWLPVELVKQGLPLLLVAVGLFFLLSPKLSDADKKARLSHLAFGPVIGLTIGFYDGIFGPGTGSFLMLSFVLLLGYGVLRATAHTKLLNFTCNFGALLVFAFGGHIHVWLGLVMGIGQFFGARLGAGLAIKSGVSLIRPLLVAMSFLMASKLIYDAWFV